MARVVAVHQPDFMPWMGFFLKAKRADVLVILDHTCNNIRDGSWFRRVKFLIGGKPTWFSVPIAHDTLGSFQPLKCMKVGSDHNAMSLFQKYRRSFQQSYGRCPQYPEIHDLFDDYFSQSDPSLLHRNMAFINRVMRLLGIETPIVFSSELDPAGHSTAMLVEIVRSVGGDTYLSGDGASGYQDDHLFFSAGLRLVKNCFVQRPYRQCGAGAFVPGLSILDMLTNEGAEATRARIAEYEPIR